MIIMSNTFLHRHCHGNSIYDTYCHNKFSKTPGHLIELSDWTYLNLAPGWFALKPVPPGTIPLGNFAQNFERDCSLRSSGTIRSKTNLWVDSPIFIICMYIH